MNALESLVGVEGLVAQATRHVRDRVDIEDVLQDAAIAILASYDKAPRKKAVWTAKSAARSALRSKKRDHKFFEESCQSVVYTNPLAALIHCEEVELLGDAMECLSERQAEAIRLRFFDGLTLEEVGEKMGITKGGAAHVVKQALEQLQDLMA